jgi:hypothetical protein
MAVGTQQTDPPTGEALNLRRNCREVDPETGELLLVGRRGKGRGRTR